MENQPEKIWVSFNRSGSICSTSTTLPRDINNDGYDHKWVEMTPTNPEKE